ncbi:MAG: DUF4342 domain-containing protein [Deltaproteobacteria bacterium]
MTASLELIEMLRERAHVSYEEAREALENCNDDIVEALIYLEKQGKIRASDRETKKSGFIATVKKLVKASFVTKFIISKDGDTIMNVPLAIVIIVTLIVPPLVIVGLLAALFTGCRIRLEKPGCSDMKINKTFDDMSSFSIKVSEQVKEVINQA